MVEGFQAIKFVMVDFDENWERKMLAMDYASINYRATGKGGKLSVVFENLSGGMSTYHYLIDAKEDVYVIDQVIHIPSRCQEKEPNNITI